MKYFLTVVILITGCGGQQKNLPIIEASLNGAQGIAEALKAKEVEKGSISGCYTAAALVSALDSSKKVVGSWTLGEGKRGVLPEVEVDLSACLALPGGDALRPRVAMDAMAIITNIVGFIKPLVFAGLESLISTSSLDCKERAIAEAVLRYLKGIIPKVLNELTEPDGKIIIPSTILSFKDCGQLEERASSSSCCPCP